MRIRYLLLMAKLASRGCTQALSARTKNADAERRYQRTGIAAPLARLGSAKPHCQAA
jgi:hypothetical protein